jgi:putative Mg2+ transporter-C (MgtC) family protein
MGIFTNQMAVIDFFVDALTNPEITLPAMIIRIFISMIAGFILGIERKLHLQNAGLRTHILICMSSCLMMIISLYIPQVLQQRLQNAGDPTRIAAQIVSGIGFLGGGAILRHGLNIKGLNSAATIWAAAGIGMAIGCGMAWVGMIVAVLCVICMVVFEKLESVYFPAEHSKQLELIFHNDSIDFKLLKKDLLSYGLIIMNVDFTRDIEKQKTKIIYTVKTSDNLDIIGLTESLKDIGKIEKVKLTD